MSTVDDDAVKRVLRQEAVDWVHRLDSGRVTHADAKAFQRWRATSPAHEAAFAEASGMWKAFAPAARNLRGRREIPAAVMQRRPLTRMMSRRGVLGGGLAVAATAAYAIVNPPLDLWPSFAELRADYRTSTGEQHELVLKNDVSVRLNTQTSIALKPSDEEADQIELITGEASFVSRPRPQRSLVVLAVDGRMTAGQADFDVRRMGSEVCVTCVDGDVAVELSADVRMIGAGQQVRYDRNRLGDVVAADIELVTAWRQGALIFRSTPLSEVVEEINRYRPGRVVLLSAAEGQKPVSGRFRIDHMDEILVRLDQAFGIKSRSLPGGIVLLG
jgi:transmembrane sensor